MKYYLQCIFLLFIPFMVKAQITDIARVEYTYFPQSSSDNSFKRFRAFGNVPIQISDDAYFVTGVEYRNVFLSLQDEIPLIIEDLQRYQSFKLSFGYTNKLQNGWRYAFQTEIIAASNFASSITMDDIIFGGSIFAIKDKTGDNSDARKPWRLIIGLNYSTTAGRPFPLPFVNYYREFAPKWTFVLGVPKTNIKYEFVPSMKLQSFITLDGFFANVQDDVEIDNGTNDVGKNISMTTLLSGMGYEWEFIDHFVFFVYGGYTLINTIRFEDNSFNEVLVINDSNSFYTRGGIKIKI